MCLWVIVLLVYLFAISHPLIKLCRHDQHLGNFFVFRDAAIAVYQGQDFYALRGSDYVYPPLIAFLYQFFAWFSPDAAGLVDLAINLVLSLTTLWLLCTEISRRFLHQTGGVVVARVAVMAALLTCDKIRGELNSWETNVLVLFMFTAALALADRRPSIAGAALGFAFNIKYLPITLFPYLILRRRWRMAAGFVLSAMVLAFLPAISIGWTGNLHALAQAYGGVAGLFNIPVHHAVHLYSMTDWRTLSVTSGIARTTGWPDRWALVFAAILGFVFLSLAAMASKRHGLAPLRWPESADTRHSQRSAMFAVEWVVVVMLTLVFSPFTNGAHLYLLLLANVAGAALLLSPRRRSSRLPLVVGMAVMYLGITLPPGGDRFRAAENFTKWIGLPTWCVLVNCGTLYWSALRAFCSEPVLVDVPGARRRMVIAGASAQRALDSRRSAQEPAAGAVETPLMRVSP